MIDSSPDESTKRTGDRHQRASLRARRSLGGGAIAQHKFERIACRAARLSAATRTTRVNSGSIDRLYRMYRIYVILTGKRRTPARVLAGAGKPACNWDAW